ncbi:MAG: hypothetical protein IPJ28_12750 [Betaproteobacteria bacterium]|nr:hypothetical protein [Betaproteobacteria bacterium]
MSAGWVALCAGSIRGLRQGTLATLGLCLTLAMGDSAAALTAEESKALADPATAVATAIRLGTQGRADFFEFPAARRNAKLIDAWRKGLVDSVLAGDRGRELEKETLGVENAVLAGRFRARGSPVAAAVFDVIRYRGPRSTGFEAGSAIPWPTCLPWPTGIRRRRTVFGCGLLPARPAFLAALGRLKYKPALPFLEELLPEGFLSTGQVAQTILAIDERFPPPALLARVRISRSPDATESERERAAGLIGVLVDHKNSTPLDYKALRAALPETLPASVQGQLVRLIRKTRSAGRLSMGAAPVPERGPGARGVPDPSLARGVVALERQANAPDNAGWAAISQLEIRLAKPEESVALVKSLTARNELSASVGAIYQRIDAIIAKPSVAPGDAEEIASLLAKWNDIVVEGAPEARTNAVQLRTWRYKSAQWLRLVAGRPREAVPQLDAIAKEGMLEAAIAAADTVQFDLDRPKEALARLEAILVAWTGKKRMPYALYNHYIEEEWLRDWLSAEIAYLRTGKRFAGKVTRPNAERAAQVVLLLEFELPTGGCGAPTRTLARGHVGRRGPARLLEETSGRRCETPRASCPGTMPAPSWSTRRHRGYRA